MKKPVLSCLLLLCIVCFSVRSSAQVPLSSGTYTQNFDSLATTGTSNGWADNTTLPGWYAAKTSGGTNVASYRADNGSSSTGALYSYGTSGSSDRALGSIGAGTPGNFAYGIRFTNDLPTAATNITISYVGEQWRNGGNANLQKLSFSYRVGANLGNADAVNSQTWIAVSNLDFVSPTANTNAAVALDGNNPTNQVIFSNLELSGVAVLPGQELFLRWFDSDDSGFDHGLGIDNLTVSFNGTYVDVRPPSIVTSPTNQIVAPGGTATFSVVADGASSLSYQWQFNGSNINSATLTTFSVSNAGTGDVGTYTVRISNAYGVTNASATLSLTTATNTNSYALSLMTYNVKGNGAASWSTNTAQVQAIGRQVMYLQPDVITFNEIPYPYTYEMTNFIKAFLPGYYMATNSGTDNYIRSVIASRYPITRSSKWLDGADLNPFGYTNANFTRDLFEAQINVPNFSRPLHVFVTHLKSSSGGYTDAAAKRAAEAAAITNFFATNFFVLYPYDPYTFSGDMNESDTNTVAIQELVSPFTGLQLENPRNPVTSSINTYSIQASVSERIDYIMPCGLLASNILSGQVFRTDLLNPLPPTLQTNDDKTASDHLPVIMYFSNPYTNAYKMTSIGISNQLITLNWQSIAGVQYRVETSTDLSGWTAIRTNMATSSIFSFSTNVNNASQFYRISRLP